MFFKLASLLRALCDPFLQLLAALINQLCKIPTTPFLMKAGIHVLVLNSSVAADAGWQINCCVKACHSEPWMSPSRQGGFFIPGCQYGRKAVSHFEGFQQVACLRMQVLNKYAGPGAMFCCLTLPNPHCGYRLPGLGSLEKENRLEGALGNGKDIG